MPPGAQSRRPNRARASTLPRSGIFNRGEEYALVECWKRYASSYDHFSGVEYGKVVADALDQHLSRTGQRNIFTPQQVLSKICSLRHQYSQVLYRSISGQIPAGREHEEFLHFNSVQDILFESRRARKARAAALEGQCSPKEMTGLNLFGPTENLASTPLHSIPVALLDEGSSPHSSSSIAPTAFYETTHVLVALPKSSSVVHAEGAVPLAPMYWVPPAPAPSSQASEDAHHLLSNSVSASVQLPQLNTEPTVRQPPHMLHVPMTSATESHPPFRNVSAPNETPPSVSPPNCLNASSGSTARQRQISLEDPIRHSLHLKQSPSINSSEKHSSRPSLRRPSLQLQRRVSKRKLTDYLGAKTENAVPSQNREGARTETNIAKDVPPISNARKRVRSSGRSEHHLRRLPAFQPRRKMRGLNVLTETNAHEPELRNVAKMSDADLMSSKAEVRPREEAVKSIGSERSTSEGGNSSMPVTCKLKALQRSPLCEQEASLNEKRIEVKQVATSEVQKTPTFPEQQALQARDQVLPSKARITMPSVKLIAKLGKNSDMKGVKGRHAPKTTENIDLTVVDDEPVQPNLGYSTDGRKTMAVHPELISSKSQESPASMSVVSFVETSNLRGPNGKVTAKDVVGLSEQTRLQKSLIGKGRYRASKCSGGVNPSSTRVPHHSDTVQQTGRGGGPPKRARVQHEDPEIQRSLDLRPETALGTPARPEGVQTRQRRGVPVKPLSTQKRITRSMTNVAKSIRDAERCATGPRTKKRRSTGSTGCVEFKNSTATGNSDVRGVFSGDSPLPFVDLDWITYKPPPAQNASRYMSQVTSGGETPIVVEDIFEEEDGVAAGNVALGVAEKAVEVSEKRLESLEKAGKKKEKLKRQKEGLLECDSGVEMASAAEVAKGEKDRITCGEGFTNQGEMKGGRIAKEKSRNDKGNIEKDELGRSGPVHKVRPDTTGRPYDEVGLRSNKSTCATFHRENRRGKNKSSLSEEMGLGELREEAQCSLNEKSAEKKEEMKVGSKVNEYVRKRKEEGDWVSPRGITGLRVGTRSKWRDIKDTAVEGKDLKEGDSSLTGNAPRDLKQELSVPDICLSIENFETAVVGNGRSFQRVYSVEMSENETVQAGQVTPHQERKISDLRSTAASFNRMGMTEQAEWCEKLVLRILEEG